MKVSGVDDLLERLHGRAGPEAGEVLLQIVSEAATGQLLLVGRVVVRQRHRIDDRGAESAQVLDGFVESGDHVGVGGVVRHLTQHPQALPLQPIHVQELEIALCAARVTCLGRRIGGIGAYDDVEHSDGVGDGPRHRPADVARQIERHDSVAARQTHRRSDARQAQVRRRAANRVAGIGAEAHGSEAGRHRRGCAATGSSRHAVGGVWVARVAWQGGPDRLVRREREFRHVGLREDDASSLAHPPDLERVIRWHRLGQ